MFISYENLTLNKKQNFPVRIKLKSRFDLSLYYVSMSFFKQNYSAYAQGQNCRNFQMGRMSLCNLFKRIPGGSLVTEWSI